MQVKEAQRVVVVTRPGVRYVLEPPFDPPNPIYEMVEAVFRQLGYDAARAGTPEWNPLGDELSIEQPWRDPHIRFFTPETMSRMLRHSGFSEANAKAHGGCFLDHLTSRPTNFGVSPIYRRAEARFPSLLGATIHAVATK